MHRPLLTAALLSLAACGGNTAETAATTTTATVGTSACAPVGSYRNPPVDDDFAGDCRALAVGNGKENVSRVVDGAFEVVLSSNLWVGWVDLNEPIERMRIEVTAEAPVTDDLGAIVVLTCQGPQPGLNSFRFGVGPTSQGASILILRDPQEPEPFEIIAREVLPVEAFRQPARLGFVCSAGPNGVELEGSVNGDVVLTATVDDATGFAPFAAAGIRLEKVDGAPESSIVLDDLRVDDGASPAAPPTPAPTSGDGSHRRQVLGGAERLALLQVGERQGGRVHLVESVG